MTVQHGDNCISQRKFQSQSYFKIDVIQSARLGIETLRDLWPYFACSQDGCGFICHGARRLVCRI